MARKATTSTCSCTSIRDAQGCERQRRSTHGSALYTDIMKTEGAEAGARQVQSSTRPSAAPGATRKSLARQGAHLFLPHRRTTAGIRESQRPELWNALQRAQASARAKAIRAFPISNWTELDIWQLHPSRETSLSCRSTSRRAALRGQARRHDHGRRRSAHRCVPGESLKQEERHALPHARLLPADRGDRVAPPPRSTDIIH
jgi:hypothetical protein